MHEELTIIALDRTVATKDISRQNNTRVPIIVPVGFLYTYKFGVTKKEY